MRKSACLALLFADHVGCASASLLRCVADEDRRPDNTRMIVVVHTTAAVNAEPYRHVGSRPPQMLA
jgi:hypothetical protein